MVICQHFLKGQCRFGNKCYNEHSKGGMFGRPNQPTTGINQRQNPFGVLPKQPGTLFSQPSTAAPTGNQQPPIESILQSVKNDMQMWTSSKIWPLSCFSANKEQSCISGLKDISPDELRVEAYSARASGNPQNYQKYIDGVGQLVTQNNKRRTELKSMTLSNFKNEMLSNNNSTSGQSGSFAQSSNPFQSKQSGQPVFGAQQSQMTIKPGHFSPSTGGLFSGQPTQLFSSPQTTKAQGGLFTSNTPSQTLFGQQTPSQTVFGQQKTTQTVFGQQTPTQVVFGQQNPVRPVFGQQTPTQTAFGQQPPTQTPFGQQPPTQTAFGQQPTTQTAFGQQPPTQTAFGQQPTTQTAFGQQPTTQTAFGQQPPTQTAFGQQPTTQTAFGQQPPTQTVFGQQTPTQTVFGQQTSTFTQQPQQQQQSTFGQQNPFGTPQQQPNPIQQSHFGQPNSTAASQSLFSQPKRQGLFSNSQPGYSNPFGGQNTSSGLTLQSGQNTLSSQASTVPVPPNQNTSPPATNNPFLRAQTLQIQQATLQAVQPVSVPPPVPSKLTLTEKDIAAFKAADFILGEIPECPPPPELC